jgi:hypothetical protein
MRWIFVLAFVLASPANAQTVAVPAAALDSAFDAAQCIVTKEESLEMAQSYDIDNGRKIVVAGCWRAAYQAGDIVFVIEPDGAARLMSFERPRVGGNGKGMERVQQLSEAAFDPAKKTMSSFHKGRGIGDCGSMGEWAWTGTEFRLKAFFFKEKCDGKLFSGGKRWQVFPAKR